MTIQGRGEDSCLHMAWTYIETGLRCEQCGIIFEAIIDDIEEHDDTE